MIGTCKRLWCSKSLDGLLMVFAISCAKQLSAIEPAEILAAWNARESCEEPFVYEFDSVWDHLPCKELGDDLQDHERHEYQSVFGRCKDKLGFRRIGETHIFADDTVFPSEFHWMFDEKREVQGFLNRIEPGSKPIRAYLVPARYPDPQFTNGLELVPFLRYHSPMSVLTRVNWEPDRMQVIGRVPGDDAGLVDLVIPRKDSNWLMLVVVDPSMKFAPLQMTCFRNGILESELSCTYTPRTGKNDATAHRLATYEHQLFSGGVAYDTQLVTVTRALFGDEVCSSQVFTIDFPEGSLAEVDE